MLVVTFQVGNERLALDVRRVHEIVPYVRLQSVACGPPWLAGVFIYRGQIVPVIDLHRLRGVGDCPVQLSTRIILVPHMVDGQERLVGLLAAKVADIREMQPPSPTAGSLGTPGRPSLGPVLVDGKEIIHLAELERLLSRHLGVALQRGLSMRIAIVNDLALAREVLRRLVHSVPGYRVAWTAENGEEAVRKAAQDRPDIILMDLVMPVLDGIEATRRIMANSPCPILLVTSSVTGNFNMVYRAMGCGGLDAVNTPTLAPDGTVRDGEGILARVAKLARQQEGAAVVSLCDREFPTPYHQVHFALARGPWGIHGRSRSAGANPEGVAFTWPTLWIFRTVLPWMFSSTALRPGRVLELQSCSRAWAATGLKDCSICDSSAGILSVRIRPAVWSTACRRPLPTRGSLPGLTFGADSRGNSGTGEQCGSACCGN